MTIKCSIIEKCVFTNEWKNPSGTTTYYHELKLTSGETGSIGVMEKYAKKISEGETITYTLENGKIKLTTMDNSFSTQKQTKPVYTGARNGTKKQDDFLGYAWSYAKDMIIAGKTMNDVEELNKVATYIYEQMGKQLNNK